MSKVVVAAAKFQICCTAVKLQPNCVQIPKFLLIWRRGQSVTDTVFVLETLLCTIKWHCKIV